MHSLGLVVGKFGSPHLGHQLLLEIATDQVGKLLVLVYAHPDVTHPTPWRAKRRELPCHWRGSEGLASTS